MGLATGSLGARAIGRSLLSVGARALPRLLRPVFFQTLRFLGGRIARFCLTAARTYTSDIHAQEEANRLREATGGSSRAIDEAGAIQRALVKAISALISREFSDRMGGLINANMSEALPHDWMQAGLRNRINRFVAQRVITTFVSRGILSPTRGISNALIRARRGENYQKALADELIMMFQASAFADMAGAFASGFVETLSGSD